MEGREMASQVIYQTNAEWYTTSEALASNPLVITYETEKGLLQFNFKGSRTIFQLSAEGKMQVKWNDISEKKILYRFVKKLLVAKNNEELVIRPLKQQAWIDYPVPDSFKLYWCDQETEFVLKKENSDKPQSEFGVRLAKVRNAIEKLRHQFRFFREPTANEVALESACIDSDALSAGMIFARCKPVSGEGARWVAEKAINLAGWLVFKQKNELNPQLIALTQQAINNSSLEIMERAQIILKNYPNLAPRVNGSELTWPDETKKTWIEVFGYPPPATQHWILWPASLLSRSYESQESKNAAIFSGDKKLI